MVEGSDASFDVSYVNFYEASQFSTSWLHSLSLSLSRAVSLSLALFLSRFALPAIANAVRKLRDVVCVVLTSDPSLCYATLFYTTTPHMLVDLSAPRFMPVPVSLVFVVEYHAQFYPSSSSLFLSSFSPFHFISLSTSLYVFLLLSPSPLSDCC